MKDATDKHTIDLLPLPRGRGRPKTTTAKSTTARAAEKQARDRQLAQFGKFDQISPSGLIELMRSPSSPCKFEAWAEWGRRAGFLAGFWQHKNPPTIQPVENAV